MDQIPLSTVCRAALFYCLIFLAVIATVTMGPALKVELKALKINPQTV